MTAKLKIGFVGVGRRGLSHMDVASRFDRVSIEAACDVDESRLKEVAAKYKVRTYKSLDEMLEKEDLDIAVISTPTPLHVPQTIKCVKAGLDVMLEKPITLKLDEANELLRVVKSSDRIVCVGFQSRYSNAVKKAKEAIEDETLSMLSGFWYWTIPIIKWIRRRDMGGGQIVDQAIHLVDLFRYFAGEVDSVYAVYTEKGRNTEADIAMGFINWASYVVAVRFKNGAIGSLHTTYALYPGVFRSKSKSEAVEDVATRESSVGLDIICREKLIRYVHPIETRVYTPDKEVEVFKTARDPTIDMWEAFIEAVINRDKSLVSTIYEDTYKTMCISLAANESAKTGNVIKLDSFCSE